MTRTLEDINTILEPCRNPSQDVIDYVRELPNEVAINNAESLLLYNGDLPNPKAICSGDGGVGIVWKWEGYESLIEYECENDGAVWIKVGENSLFIPFLFRGEHQQ